ncbi:hypothetical protein [Calorimonas adulescens]|jgi:hypothetical protein|uniref:Uncharacterized protein n=1 Tax=Calorimonas adulescens TaxID=2606906 RepID=A0A5D8QFR4_9THEO|nr:hypothetical protein [Calorimonas adulescens]TZE83540.1 hypothetical protein FWJ32_01270 [Calorimonas adulescens]
MAGKAKDRWTAEGKKFKAEIEKLKKLQVRIGYQQGDVITEDGVDMLDIAMWNELGTINAPSRPFLRKSVDENADKINSFCKAQLQRLTKGETAEEILKQIGVFSKGLVQEKIVDGEFEPNAPSTIRRKKSDKPLIDTGLMRKSVNYIIVEKGGRK